MPLRTACPGGRATTPRAFTGVRNREGITTSMDGRGRVYDNMFVERLWRSVKHEGINPSGYATMGELRVGLTKYLAFYNTERPHPSLDNPTPQEVHQTSSGGGGAISWTNTQAKTDAQWRCAPAGLRPGKLGLRLSLQYKGQKNGAAPSSCVKWRAT